MAERVAISRARTLERTITRFAMLTQPRSSTNSTPPQSRYNTGRNLTNDVVLQTHGDRMESGVLQNLAELRKPLVVARVDRVHLLLRERDVRARLQPADHLPVVAVARVVRFFASRERGRNPDVDLLPEELEALRENTLDRVVDTVQPDVPADGRGVAAKLATPEIVRQEGLALLPFFAVRFGEELAVQRHGPNQPEERRRRAHGANPLGSRGLGANRHVLPSIQRLLVERRHLPEPIEVVGHRGVRARRAGVRITVVNVDNPLRIGDRKGLEQHRPDDAEDRGVRADSDGEGQQSGGGKGSVLDEKAERETNVGKHTDRDGSGQPGFPARVSFR